MYKNNKNLQPYLFIGWEEKNNYEKNKMELLHITEGCLLVKSGRLDVLIISPGINNDRFLHFQEIVIDTLPDFIRRNETGDGKTFENGVLNHTPTTRPVVGIVSVEDGKRSLGLLLGVSLQLTIVPVHKE